MVSRSGLLAFGALVIGGGAALAVAFQIYGPERIWARSGPADQGDVDFAALSRRDTPNDALACGDGLCAARADVASPVFALAAEELFYRVQQAVAGEPRLVLMAKEPRRGVLRYVQRSLFFRFPDTINVKVQALPNGRSTLLLYSRSQLGRSDMGVNRERIERWIRLVISEAQK